MTTDSVIKLQLPAAYHHLSILETPIKTLLDQVKHHSDCATIAYNIQLALHEICVNIVDHAYKGMTGGQIGITLTLHPDTVCFVAAVCDTGRTFDPSQVPQPDPQEPQVRGYGLFLAKHLMDEVTYTALPEENRWHLVKHLATSNRAKEHHSDTMT